MKTITMASLLFLLIAPAFAQTPAITGLHIRADVAVATGVGGGGATTTTGTTTTAGAITTGSGTSTTTTTTTTTGSAATATGKKSPCASSPYTADAAIFSVLLVLEPQIDGLTKFRNVNGALSDQKTPQTVYFMTSTPIQMTTLRTQRREYPVTNKYINELWIENLSWADASDILSELQSAPALVTGPIGDAIRAAGGLSYSFVQVTLPAPSDSFNRPDVDLTNQLAGQDTFNYRPDRWARTIDALSKMTSLDGRPVTPTNVTITASQNAQITVEPTSAASNLSAIIGSAGTNGGTISAAGTAGSAPVGRILLVDSPCLTVALLPALTGSNVTGGTLQFNGRYLFPWRQGHSFARLGVSGESPINGGTTTSSLSKFGAVFDLALNKDQQPATSTAPIRFTGGLTTTFDHSSAAGGVTMSKAAGGAKGSISFPNITPLLLGDDTRPTLTFEAVGSTIHPGTSGTSTTLGSGGTGSTTGTGGSTSQFEGNAKFKAKFRWTEIFNSSIDAKFLASHDKIYGGRKTNYLINVDVLKFIVKDPLEFAATWRCGRSAPDYKKICGFFAGVSLTSNQ